MLDEDTDRYIGPNPNLREPRRIIAGHHRRSPSCRPASVRVRALTFDLALEQLFELPAVDSGKCVTCLVPLDDTEAFRIHLFDLGVAQHRALIQQSMARKAADDAKQRVEDAVAFGRRLYGLTMTELEKLAGVQLGRHHVYKAMLRGDRERVDA